MPEIVVKPDPDMDLYVTFSTVTDGFGQPVPRVIMEEHLISTAACQRCAEVEAAERLARADEFGSSAGTIP